MTNALTVSELTKTYQDFVLDQVSFSVPSGSIVGLIGENGAGKSTTINAALGLIQKEAGQVSVLGKDGLDDDTKEEIGVVFDGSNYPEILSPKKLNGVMKNIYRSWDETAYFRLLKQFSLPPDKPLKQFSKGMKMKLAISVALSHHSKLLILDEATSGLDPVIRDDILDMLLDFVQEEDHSILVSSHITSDLEKIADYIVFIHEGKVVFSKPKDELVEQYGILKCGAAQFDALDKADIIVYRKMDYEWQVLVADREKMQKKYPKAMVVPATIDEIMLLYVKGGKVMKGVLLKDLYIAKSNILVTVVSLVVLGFGLSFLLETSALLVLAPVASTTAVFISITSDAASKWNKNVITMLVSRGQIIGEKFVFYILLAVLGLVTALIPCLILGAFGVDMTLHSLCLYGSIGVSATLLAGGISLPCAYLFDPEKSQIVFMMSFMASTGIIVGIVLLTNLFIPVKENILLAFNIVLAISAVWFFISYRIAVKVYQKRDIT